MSSSGHCVEDITGLYLAYRSGRYGITAGMMEPLSDTILYVMRSLDGKFIQRVDGKLPQKDHPWGGLGSKWLGLCECSPDLLHIVHEISRQRIKSRPDLKATIL